MSGIKEKAAIGVGIGLGVAALTSGYYWYQRWARNAYPKAWRRVGTLTKLAFTPIKSCRAVYLNEADCKLTGLEHNQCRDHMFMLIDDTNKVVTSRGYPHMLKIKQETSSEGITVTAPGMEPLSILFSEVAKDQTVKANIFGADVYVVECGGKYNEWFANFILKEERGLRLVYYPYMTPTKPIHAKLENGIFLKDDTGTLQDVSSYMIINEKSVQDLNTRLKVPVDPMQFRPNFLVQTDGPAYDEDSWNWVKIGNQAVFRAVCPCYRCIFVNINPETAERSPDSEPLTTLKRYRCFPNQSSPTMGVQLGLRAPGHINIGDEVFVGV